MTIEEIENKIRESPYTFFDAFVDGILDKKSLEFLLITIYARAKETEKTKFDLNDFFKRRVIDNAY